MEKGETVSPIFLNPRAKNKKKCVRSFFFFAVSSCRRATKTSSLITLLLRRLCAPYLGLRMYSVSEVTSDQMVSGRASPRSASSSLVGSPRFMEALQRDRTSPRRQEVEQRRLDRKHAEEAALVFSPRIPSSSEKLDLQRSEKEKAAAAGTGLESPRHARLYQDALKRQTEGPKLKTASPTTELDGFAFSPRIPRRSRSLSKDRLGRDADPGAPSVSERLHATKGSGRERVPVSSSGKEEEEVFRPKIPRRSASLMRSSGDIEARWRSADERRTQELEQIRAEVDEDELAPCSFAPAITKMAKKLGTAPKGSTLTWTDTAYGGSGSGGAANHKAADRLMRYKQDLKAKKDFLRRQHEEEQRKALSPTPAIPRKSRALLAAQARPADDRDVHTRLAQSSTHQVADAVIADLAATCTFQPTLVARPPSPSKSPATWTDAGADSAECEPGDSVYERLHREAASRKKAQEEAGRKAEEAARAFPYAPTLPSPPTAGTKQAGDDAYPETCTIFERLASDVNSKNFMHALLEQVPYARHPTQGKGIAGPVVDIHAHRPPRRPRCTRISSWSPAPSTPPSTTRWRRSARWRAPCATASCGTRSARSCRWPACSRSSWIARPRRCGPGPPSQRHLWNSRNGGAANWRRRR